MHLIVVHRMISSSQMIVLHRLLSNRYHTSSEQHRFYYNRKERKKDCSISTFYQHKKIWEIKQFVEIKIVYRKLKLFLAKSYSFYSKYWFLKIVNLIYVRNHVSFAFFFAKMANKACMLCTKTTDNISNLGKKFTYKDVTAHHYCLVRKVCFFFCFTQNYTFPLLIEVM